MKTTLNAIREHGPCEDGWKKLLKYLGKTGADNDPLSILTVLDSNGIDDALWTLRAVNGHDREMRLFAVWCARRVERMNSDPRVKACNDTTERYANGEATDKELAAAWAAGAAAWAAGDAAWAAGDAAWAAGDAAWAAAWAAAGDAAGAARAAAGDAAGAARAAAGDAAWAAAGDAAREAQAAELRRVCEAIDAGLDPYPRAK